MLQHADVAFFSGLIDMDQRITAMTMQLQVSQLIAYGAACPCAAGLIVLSIVLLQHSSSLVQSQTPATA